MNEVEKTMVENMPKESQGPQAVTEGSAPDSSGAVFDPSLHQLGKDGSPVITKKGLFKKRRGTGTKSKIADMTPPDSMANFQACGSTSAEIIFIACQGIGGPDWTPRDEERAYMTEAFTQYYTAKDVQDLPPGVILATALISYGAPRFVMPTTQGRFKRAVAWTKNKIKTLRGIRTPEKVEKPKDLAGNIVQGND